MRPCESCTAHDYYRLYMRLRASVLQEYVGCSSCGYKQAWIEADRNDDWGASLVEFEPAKPLESYAGRDDQTVSIGLGSSWSIDLGVPALSAGGTVDQSFGGSVTSSSENWHPVIRAEDGSGCVQWCRHTAQEFTGTRLIAARVGVRIGRNASPGSWSLLMGQRDFTDRCPTQI